VVSSPSLLHVTPGKTQYPFYRRLGGPQGRSGRAEISSPQGFDPGPLEGKYLPTPCCRTLLEKLTGLQLVKKFPAFHGTRRFTTALTSVRQLSPSWASPIQSIYLHPTSKRSILILSTHLRLGLPIGLLPSGFKLPHPFLVLP